jgi:WD40 repeat protein/DNA-binding SARP family transcriptional activator
LAYLLLYAGTAHRREKLAGLLWPDATDTNARRNLRQELWRLRKAFDTSSPGQADFIASDDLSVGINPDAPYWLDSAVLEKAANSSSADDLMQALAAYSGELLPGFYEEWVALERERLLAQFERQIGRLLDYLLSAQRWDDVLAWAERWIAQGASPEPAYRALMMAHSALGNQAQVRAVFERCLKALQAGLGVEPSDETRGLYERLRAGEVAGAGGRQQAAPVSLRAPARAPDDAPPYKGLRYFDEADAELFYGREALVAALVNHLRDYHILAVVGASGSGKSSLVRAGLVPALKTSNGIDGAPADEQQSWAVYVFTPTSQPLEALAVALTRAEPSPLATTTLMDDLARDSRVLRIFFEKTQSQDRHVLLVIDQFEELYTLCHDESVRQSFVDNLLNATAPELDQPIRLVVALRADFYAHCAQSAKLRSVLAQRQEFIGPMSRTELRRAIEEPAQRSGWSFEAGLVDTLLRDAGNEPGALPLLSHALLETWKRRDGRTLTAAGYGASGGVRGAIAHTAETVYASLSDEQKTIARNIFLRLTELGEGTPDTRRRAALSEFTLLTSDAAGVETILSKLADARLISLGEGTAEVAHEALISEWPTLREWLSQDRDGLRLHRHLTEAAQAWLKLNRDEGELYRGTRLAQALEWARDHGADLNPLERDFLLASKESVEREEEAREAQRRRELEAARKLAEAERQRAEVQTTAAHRLRQRALFLLGALMLVALLAASSAIFAQQANQNAAHAEDERRIAFVRELSVNAVANLNVDPERSILLALQAVSVSSTGGQPVLREAEEALDPPGQTSRGLLTQRGHTLNVSGLAFSPDGRSLVTGSQDKMAKVWDVSTGKEMLTLSGHTDGISGVAFSPNGSRIVTTSDDNTAKVWDVTTGKELLTLAGHTGELREIAFSPDGRRIATTSTDTTAKVWDAATGKELLTFTGHTGEVRGIAFSPDGRRIATGSFDKTAKIWDAATGKELLTLSHDNAVFPVAFSPDGARLATGSNALIIWDATSGRKISTLIGHTNVIFDAVFNSSGTRLASGSADGTAKVWDLATGQVLLTLAGHTGQVQQVAFSPDGTRLATSGSDTTAKVWDISPAGSREWLTLASDGGRMANVAYSPDGKRLATAGEDKTAKVWDAATGQQLLSLAGHGDWIHKIAFSPDGRRLVTVSSDQTAKVWDAESGREILSLSTQVSGILPTLGVAFSPDGKRVAATAAGNVVKVWDAATGREVLTLTGHRLTPTSVAYSPDGARLATGSNDRTAKVWDATTGKELLTLSGHTDIVRHVTFGPDGRRLATSSQDGTAKVWDAETGQELLTLTGHSGTVMGLSFSPDGTRLATGSSDGTAKIWDVSLRGGQRNEPLTLYGHTGGVYGVAFSPDGRRLATASTDGTTRVWALPLEDILAIAKTRVTRSLTTDECQKYLHAETCLAGQ